MIKCDEKLRKLIYLERRLEGESTKSKITEFGSRFADKLSSEVDRNFRIKFYEKQKLKFEMD